MAQGGDQDGEEKSFDPTPRKLEQAREKGDIAVSQDLHAAGAYAGLAVAVLVAGSWAAGAFGSALQPFLGLADQLEGRILGPGGLMLSAAMLGAAALAALPFFLLPAAGALASLFAQQGFTFAPDKIQPKLSRISPIATAKHKFGPTGLFEFAKSTIKMLILAALGFWWIADNAPRMIGLSKLDGRALGPELGATLLSLLTFIAAVALAIGVVDWLWQQFDHKRKLMMTLQEVRDEAKETEGDPHTKQARRRRAEEIATNRMLLDVPKADVVIVNPTHYAVALQWERGKARAPKCVAKGVDEVAARIRERAAAAGVPIHSDPPTARSLHATVEIGREIPREHYRAVAAAIRFADDMRRRARAMGRGRPPPPGGARP
jgi:flagellar biosynthetic protein FlhB